MQSSSLELRQSELGNDYISYEHEDGIISVVSMLVLMVIHLVTTSLRQHTMSKTPSMKLT